MLNLSHTHHVDKIKFYLGKIFEIFMYMKSNLNSDIYN